MSSLLTNLTVAGTVGSAIALVGVFLGLDSPRWEAQTARRQRERDALERLLTAHYRLRPGVELYDFIEDLAIASPLSPRSERLEHRAKSAASLEQARYAKGCELAVDWIGAVGVFAREAQNNRVALRRFMQTYHLGIVREGMLAVPFVMAMASQQLLHERQLEDAAYGLALVELAAFYNSVARQQRQPISFRVSRGVAVGPVVRPPRHALLSVFDLVDRCAWSFRLSRWRFRRASRLLEDIVLRLEAA